MTMTTGLRPMHPGELLREDVLPALGGKKAAIARALGVSRHTLYELLAERQDVTPQMALRLGKLCGNGAEIWGRLQLRYDLAIQSETMREELERIPTMEAA
ncbi:HigA family addiction module antitoxin [Sphingomonas sp.]|uniref:HigA family addiction module antitoxin n=1 Tax=Sphingomonas sp. TaxID=28214 RepID=UPI003BA94C05